MDPLLAFGLGFLAGVVVVGLLALWWLLRTVGGR